MFAERSRPLIDSVHVSVGEFLKTNICDDNDDNTKTSVMHDMRISASDAVWRLGGLASSGLIVRSPRA
jgi:hypothetical protein